MKCLISLAIYFFSISLFAAALFSIGNPTAEEQLYLEYINRARANPAQESLIIILAPNKEIRASIFQNNVDTNLFVQQLSSYPKVMPLSFSSNLIFAARRHANDQYIYNFQSHIGSDGSNPGSRISDSGYSWNTYGENAFTRSYSLFYGHSSFEIDWGCCGAGGMQDPPGHRNNIHNGNFGEIGIGVTNQVVVQEFASKFGLTPFITGVVYVDFNNNDFYDIGEGIGGIDVIVIGSSYYATSSSSGGYSVPVQTNGNYTVVFTDNLTLTNISSVMVTNGWNYKKDYKIAYHKPEILSKSYIVLGKTNLYSFVPTFKNRTTYEVKTSNLIEETPIEDGNQYTNFLLSISTNYSFSDGGLMRLVHSYPFDQIATLNYSIKPSTNSYLTFLSRLGWVTSNEYASVEYSIDNKNWLSLWSKNGNNGSRPVENELNLVTNYIGFLAGQEVYFRFLYDYVGGSYFYSTSFGVGWYFDAIEFSNSKRYINNCVLIGANNSFRAFVTNFNDLYLKVREVVDGNILPWGVEKKAVAIPEHVQIQSFRLVKPDFLISFYSLPDVTYKLFRSLDLTNWAIVDTIIGNGDTVIFTDSFSIISPKCFYRIKAE